VQLRGWPSSVAASMGISELKVSISHDGAVACATAVAFLRK